MRFVGCSRWRWDSTNDHEWYKVDGHGRYSGVAPRWGEFYELMGPDPDPDPDAMPCLGKRSGQTLLALGISYIIAAMKRLSSWPKNGRSSQADGLDRRSFGSSRTFLSLHHLIQIQG
ncbi:hypothetical protein [Rhizobium laguerreae]|uniref:hypothetical protein n=1 Tax=Rhizobium laguerreae TaxID=1076926 RepID=UPI001FEBDB56|nr:hypothetical protein [Rhizobium laguerreae]